MAKAAVGVLTTWAATVLLVFLQLSLTCANFVNTSDTKILDGSGQELFFSGINLGNWLVWEGYLMMGDFNYRTHTQFFHELSDALGSPDAAAEFEYQWRMNYVDEQAIADLSNLGFNSVRVPFNYKLFYADGQIVDDGFEFFDRVIDWCRTYGMYVLLDMHGAPGYQNPGDHSDNVDSNANQPRDTVKFWDGNNVQLAASIWRHIASRYSNEPVVWGYDLINEPVPQAGREYELLPSLVVMRNAIREVDNNHIIVAEGSWWGSDLTKIDWKDSQTQSQTGISSQWDDKLVYQIHHYGPASDTYGREQITNNLNIPLFIGEYGETDENNLRAITDWAKQTLEGYYPWSFKKMSHDKTLWTIPPTDAYNQVKNYINNGGSPPTHLYDEMISFAQTNIRNGHSSHEWHQGFYDAIKPSITCSDASSFAVPGQIEAELSCDEYGVQLESTSDAGGGQNIGFLNAGDYTEYNINVEASGLYTFAARVASDWSSGQMDVKVDGTLLASFSIPNTGGWQSFITQSTALSLDAGNHRLRLEFPGGGFNLNWMTFSTVSTNAPTPVLVQTPTISPTMAPSNAPAAPPTVLPTPSPVQVQTPTISPTMAPSNAPAASPTVLPTPSPVQTPTKSPTNKPTISPVNPPQDCDSAPGFAVPGYLQAEHYCDHQGVKLETTSDVGGGHNIFQLDNNDYVEYNIQVGTTGHYTFAARVQSSVYSGQINLQVDGSSVLWLSVPHTNGGWQTIWANVWLTMGTHGLRVLFPQGGFQVNWMAFAEGTNNPPPLSITPAPTTTTTFAPTESPRTVPETASPTTSPTMEPTNAPSTLAPTTSPAAPTSKNTTVSPTTSPTMEPTTDAPTPMPSPTTLTPTMINSNDPSADCSASGFAVPGVFEAEQYCNQQGIELETTSDISGGQNIAKLDNGDFVEYNLDIGATGHYTFAARVQSPIYSGQINLQVDGVSVLWLSVPHTNGGWQTIWANVWLTAGSQRLLRVAFPQGGFKINRMGFGTGTNNPPTL